MKILNLFAGIGGNRTNWGDEHEITAVDLDEKALEIYHKRFPNDKIVVADAYEYVVEHFNEFDFVWASPPCKTHSRLNAFKQNIRLPDLRLYELIIFLKQYFDGKWVVENVVPYYELLIPPTIQLSRHLFWSNFTIPRMNFQQPKGILKDLKIEILQEWHNIYETTNREYLRNCVDWRIGKYILDCAENNVFSLDKYMMEEEK